ncbi:MAG: hypothetical protein Q7U42_09465 [Parvibaculum sp.]|nr:hypothetical protein [Parvibaculum sp.]
MSNFLVGIVVGFFICVWTLDASPVAATIALVDRIRQVEVSFAAEPKSEVPVERAEAGKPAASAVP